MRELPEYYDLTKPGIVYGNAIPVIAGFLLASRGMVNGSLFITTLVGISLVIAGGCVFNNYIDRDIDGAMERTKDRALVMGRISTRAALVYGVALSTLGFLILALGTNVLTTAIAAFGFFFYVFMYSLWFKRRGTFGTVIGSVSGAVPSVVGYCAVSGRLDAAAVILFAIMVLWQMPHFFAIAIYRLKEYTAAGVQVLPVKDGIRATKIEMLLYIIAFVLVAPLLTVFGYAGQSYFWIALFLGLVWLGFCVQGFWVEDDSGWARIMFRFSLVVMMALFIAIGASGFFV